MHLADTKIKHNPGGWKVDFIGDDGDALTIRVTGGADLNEEEPIEGARSVMMQLTAFGTRGGGRSLNRYDATSNGNFHDDEPVARHLALRRASQESIYSSLRLQRC
jgi:hypothetical protein